MINKHKNLIVFLLLFSMALAPLRIVFANIVDNSNSIKEESNEQAIEETENIIDVNLGNVNDHLHQEENENTVESEDLNEILDQEKTIEDEAVKEEISSSEGKNDDLDYLDNPDHLSEPDDSPYAGEIDYNSFPETEFPSVNEKSSLRATSKSLIIGKDNPTEPGEVMLFKEAKPVEGMFNTWDVTLRVEGKNKPVTSDIILVIDTSGSMNDDGRMEAAKNAATAFVETLLPSDTTKIGIVSFADYAYLKKDLTNNVNELKSSIDDLNAKGGTFTQAGIKQAQAMLAKSQANYKNIVLLSDGVPTYSYELKNLDDYLIQYGSGNNKQTSDNAPADAYNYDEDSGRVGDGTSMLWLYNWWWPFPQKFYNHGNSAIAEAGFAKNAGSKVWTVGLSVNPNGAGVLESMASSSSYYPATTENLKKIFENIAGQIGSAVKDAVISDPMGVGFEIPIGEVENIRVSQGTHSYENKKITWNAGTLTTPISPKSDINYAEMTYRIVVNDDILNEEADEEGKYPTNGNAVVSYTDAEGKSQTDPFPIPKVKPVLLKIKKILKDEYGNTITNSNLKFSVKIKSFKTATRSLEETIELTPNEEYLWLAEPGYDGKYEVKEIGVSEGSLENYYTSYYVDGTNTTTFNLGEDFENVNIEVVNQVIPQDIDFSFTKVKEDGTTPLGGATFELSNEDDSSFTKITIENPENAVFTFEDLKEGTYILTEIKAPGSYKLPVNNTWKIMVTRNKTSRLLEISIPPEDSYLSGSLEDGFILKNFIQGEFPQTGGIGSMIYLGVGSLIMARSLGLYNKENNKKKKDKE